MTGRAMPRQLMTVEEYREYERNSLVKHEYVGGHVYAMTGVSRRHSRIAGKILLCLAEVVAGGPCRVHQSAMQVPTPDGPWCYPDVVVARAPEPDDPCIEEAPCVLVEVISPTTESIDRHEKLLAYRRNPGLRAYLTVERERPAVECHYRDEAGQWQSALSNDGSIAVPCPETTLSLADIYDGIA